MELPQPLLMSLREAEGFNKDSFEQVHIAGEQVTSVRFNPNKAPGEIFSKTSPIPWAANGYYLSERPSFTFDPLFHAGCYYVQEASSMFLEQTLKQTVDLTKPLKVLDLCAAPGGKSTHIQSLISKDSLLVSNEVIRSRAGILKDNIIKWGCQNVVVTSNDPKDFSKLQGYFDVVVVDAPCSGSGLFRREPEAINEWSENNVQLCSQRQQRILADILPTLKEDGILIYSTCSYSREEDEDICNWLEGQCSMINVQCTIKKEWGIVESGGGYRFWPDKVKGEGFFLACFKKKSDGENNLIKPKKKIEAATKKELDVIHSWVHTGAKTFVKNQNTVYAWPESMFADFSFLLESMKVIYAGVLVGELMRDKLIPAHALAMSNIRSANIPLVNLDKETAIRFLQRKDILSPAGFKSWCLAGYEDNPLGWMNILPNRVNNYYPKELRILKEAP